MSPTQKRRMIVVVLIVGGIGLATALALTAFQKNLLYFVTPTEVKSGTLPTDKQFRVGGLVVNGSVQRDGVEVQFDLTDGANAVPVVYSGILPDLFREGQGVIALGTIDNAGIFQAEDVLAKHDENYMPPEIAEALKDAQNIDEQFKQGHEQ
ncbi:MAG: Cytochrome c-type biogenesis protein CcmE [Gammaproteobacteria bacterium]|nr:Cytochrome c-type biogenesis protein CcmE [Gammaproteobacteria bacterium]